MIQGDVTSGTVPLILVSMATDQVDTGIMVIRKQEQDLLMNQMIMVWKRLAEQVLCSVKTEMKGFQWEDQELC